jgi:SecD/SecF fusion protein
MVENLSRKITLILSLLTLAVVSLCVAGGGNPLHGFRLGLDLEGGTRLAYSLDLQEAHEKQLITDAEYADPTQLWNDIRKILTDRLDPTGVREPVIRLEGEERFVIELPGSASVLRRSVSLALAEPISVDARALTLNCTEEEAQQFPGRGAQVQIGAEIIRYGRRVGTQLESLERNYGDASGATEHAAGAIVTLSALDPWRDKIENIGSMTFLMQALPADVAGSGTDLTTELNAARAWADLPENENVSIEEYNKLLSSREGVANRLRFFPLTRRDAKTNKIIKPETRGENLQVLIQEENTSWQFTGGDVQRVYYSTDKWGQPAVSFEMKTYAHTSFGNFTEEHIDEQMAIIINDEIATMPQINDRLPGSSLISGDFTIDEANDLVTVLRSGSLPLKPRFEGQETVGATLGEAYVKRGFLGIGLGLGLVLIFMMIYYRRLGMFAALSLVANLVLLTGALAFLQATLTLPGVAGILLTVGMAVDANILIYERIREEANRGRKPLQSAKDGFAHALSTIVDANLTTLITGLILYRFGTGPVRGFATTLSIGIITSMFSALVVTRVLVHMQLERGIDRFSMARLINETKVKFMAKSKTAMMASSVLILGGVGFFLSLDAEEKLGIDFLGGMTMTVSLAEAQETETVNQWIGEVPGIIGESAEVKPIRNSQEGENADNKKVYTRFRITAKGSQIGIEEEAGVEASAKIGAGNVNALDVFRKEVGAAVEGKLAPGPVEDVTVENGQATGLLYLEHDHPPADLVAGLAKLGLVNATTQARADKGERVVQFSGTVASNVTGLDLTQSLETDLSGTKDSQGRVITLSNPIDEVNAVGAQVVGELRDKAIFAVLLSLFAAVMYIRVRFAEYSFGFAAVVALTHDVLITLGALALADKFIPFIDTEINLPMIAAFLTIIGYSLNDTIVVFDRVRENLPRMKGSLSEVIDRSINQCLSRTVLTSITTLISVVLLLAFNLGTGNVIEGFAFALMIGVVVGTYSSMFVASPVLLWLETRRQKKLSDDDPTKHGAQVEASTA